MPFLDRVLPRLDRVDRARLEEILRGLAGERDFFEKTLNLLDEGIVATDAEGRMLFANRAAESLLDAAGGSFAGRELKTALRDAPLRACVGEALETRAGVLGREIPLGDAGRGRITMSMAPIEGEGGALNGAVFTFRNTSEEMLKQARYAQLKGIEVMRVMAAGIAHEIGNPLNSLGIHLQLVERALRRMKLGKRAKLFELIGVAKEEIRRLTALLTQVLRTGGPDIPEMREGDLVATVDKTLDLMEPEVRQHGINLTRVYSAPVPPVMLNADQMRQVIINLIQNAVQSMPSGGMIRVEIGWARGYVTVSVSDSGCGIPEEKVDRILEPYYTTRRGGTGLGLMIVQKIVAEHEGDLRISSSPGKGTTITLRIPVPRRYGKLLPGGEGEINPKSK